MAAAQVDAASKLLEAPGPSEVEEDSEDAVTTLLGAPEDIADDNKDDISRKAPLLFIKDGGSKLNLLRLIPHQETLMSAKHN